MKFSLAALAAVAGLTDTVMGHYYFDRTVVNGKTSSPLQYIRGSTRPTKYNPIKWTNVRDNSTPDLDDIRCNQGAFTNAGKTGVLEIAAGTKIGFKLAIGNIIHPGPNIAYMSKAPNGVKNYRGDGPWFKIGQTGVCNQGGDFTTDAWCSWHKDTIEFTIPKNTPNGEYLLRMEHIGVHGNHVGQTEFYPACAQIKVTNGGNGTPGPTFTLPGGYKKTDPGFTLSIYGGYKAYPFPGPAVWA